MGAIPRERWVARRDPPPWLWAGFFVAVCAAFSAVAYDAAAASGVLATGLPFAALAVAAAAGLGLVWSRRARRRLEAALSASEARAKSADARLLDAINNISDGIQFWDKNERLAAYNTHGFMGALDDFQPPIGITYREFLEFLARTGGLPDVVGREQEFVEAALQRHRSRRNLRVEHRVKDGRWMSVRWSPTSEGGAVALLVDITERKQAETALRDSEEKARRAHARLLDAVESLEDGFVLWDKDGRLALYNRASFGRIYSDAWLPPLGISIDDYLAELVGRGEIREGHGADFVQRSRHGFGQAVPEPVEYRVRDGRWIRAHRHPTSDGGMVGILTDITALKTAQLRAEATAAELTESREHLQTAVDSMDQGLALYDPDHRLILCNRRYRDLFRLPADAVRPGTHLRDILEVSVRIANYPPDEAARIVEGRLALAERRERHQRWIRLTDGRTIELTYEPLSGGGSLGTFRDVTERERATAALIAAKNAAEAASEAKSRFLAQMSHEFRTPLNAIIGFSELIRDRRFGDQAVARYADYAADINLAGEHLLRIVNDVLYVAQREGAGARPLADNAVDLGDQIAAARTMLAAAAGERGVRVVCDVPPGLPRLRADRTLMQQLLLNLLSNAIKFTPVGGTATITAAARPAGGLAVVVEDTGIGIAREDQERVFQPFFQGTAAPGRTREGVGLGLAICKDIVGLHGGSIAIDSTPGRGTRITAGFPASRLFAGAP